MRVSGTRIAGNRCRVVLRIFAALGGAMSLALVLVAADGGPSPGAATKMSLEGVVDLSGRAQDPFALPTNRAVVLIFISIDCPICSRYAPEIQRLQSEFSPRGVTFWLVQPAEDESVELTQRYLKEFAYSFGLLRDPKHSLVQLADATITPEAAVFGPGGRLVYHGRIDDRHADFGKTRPQPTRRELKDALEAILAGRPIAATHVPAVGCSISR